MRITPLALLLTAFVAIVASSSRAPAQSSSFCTPTESRGEGHWPIPEDGFTSDRASKALESLSVAVQATSLEADFVNLETDLVYVKGYCSSATHDRTAGVTWRPFASS